MNTTTTDTSYTPPYDTTDPWAPVIPITPTVPWMPQPTTPWPLSPSPYVPAPVPSQTLDWGRKSWRSAASFTRGYKAGNNGILINILIDESGSMGSNRSNVIESFNSWINDMREDEENSSEDTYVTVTMFDGNEVRVLAEELPLNKVPELTELQYAPRGLTNLLDAIGEVTARVDNRLKGIKKVANRPGVFFVVMTDGGENNSRSYVLDTIKKNIESRQGKNWVFTFLGANIDAFSEGSGMGFAGVSTLQYNVDSFKGTTAALSNVTSNVRSAYTAGATGDALTSSATFSDADRAGAVTPDVEGDGGN